MNETRVCTTYNHLCNLATSLTYQPSYQSPSSKLASSFSSTSENYYNPAPINQTHPGRLTAHSHISLSLPQKTHSLHLASLAYSSISPLLPFINRYPRLIKDTRGVASRGGGRKKGDQESKKNGNTFPSLACAFINIHLSLAREGGNKRKIACASTRPRLSRESTQRSLTFLSPPRT